MFDYGGQEPVGGLLDVKSANLFDSGSQLFSTDGLQIGSVSWQDGSLNLDTLWNINLVKDLTGKARTIYTSTLSLIGGPDGAPQILETIEESNPARTIPTRIRIPDGVSFDLNSAIVDQIDQGARLIVGITQKAFYERRGKVENYAYGTSVDVTDAITGSETAGPSQLTLDPVTNNYRAPRQPSGSDRSLIGKERYLDGCDFSNQDLSGLDFGRTNNGEGVRVAGTNFRNSILRNTTWGYTTEDASPPYTYAQWWSMFTKPEPRADFSYADLSFATFHLNTRAGERHKPVTFLNSTYATKSTPPPNYPIVDHAKVYGTYFSLIYPSPLTDPSNIFGPPTNPVFLRLVNKTNHRFDLDNVVTNVFNPMRTSVGPGEMFELTGTTAYYSGDDITLDIGGIGRVVVNNPPVGSSTIKIGNDHQFSEGTWRLDAGDYAITAAYKGTSPRKGDSYQEVWEMDIDYRFK